MTEKHKEEKHQKEATWDIEDKLKGRILNIVSRAKELFIENKKMEQKIK